MVGVNHVVRRIAMWAVGTSVVAHDSISSKTDYNARLLIYGEKNTYIVANMTIL